jgi:SAM-dependent methyltransferase
VSWYQARPEMSLRLIEVYVPNRDAALMDIGGGASRLTDELANAGYRDLSVLDISEEGLSHLKKRMGCRATGIHWVVADVTLWTPDRIYDLWHDRALLHFLTEAKDQSAYAAALRAALKPSAIAIIAGFAPGGPEKCSGLPVVQHDHASLGALLGTEFEFVETREEVHLTPWNTEQAFRYHVMRRHGPSRE